MAWTSCQNHSIKKLEPPSVQNSFSGGIRRDPIARKAQIKWWNEERKTSEWVDLINYRYGMDEGELTIDIQKTGISKKEWSRTMAIVKKVEIQKHNESKTI